MSATTTTVICGVLLAVYVSGAFSTPLAALGVRSALANTDGSSEGKLKPIQKPRILFIRSLPASEHQSPLYEVRQVPYLYVRTPRNHINAVRAVAVIQGEGEAAIKGELEFVQRDPPVGPVMISGNVTGLTTGLHGLHIHPAGDMRGGCSKLGDHFNPYMLQHGGPLDPIRHLGDLGNIDAKDGGTAHVFLVDPLLSLTNGPRGIVGRSIVITKDQDDLGRGGTAESLANGSSGEAVACGVIAYVQ